jgi:hypothetical protein
VYSIREPFFYFPCDLFHFFIMLIIFLLLIKQKFQDEN